MIILDRVDESDLRWFVNADYASSMGQRSGMGAMLDATGPSIPGTRAPSDHALEAARKLREKFLPKWANLDRNQRALLHEAFLRRDCWVGRTSGDFDTKWKKFGTYPGVLYANNLGIYGMAGSTDNELNRFFRSRVHDPDRPADGDGKKKRTRAEKRAGKKQTKVETKIVIRHTAAMPVSCEIIRERGEHALFEALQAFGARVEYRGSVQPVRRTFSLREIGRAWRKNHETVAEKLRGSGCPLKLAPNGRSLMARLSDLDRFCVEAADAVRVAASQQMAVS